jgi:hypothetical protein
LQWGAEGNEADSVEQIGFIFNDNLMAYAPDSAKLSAPRI